MEIIMDFNKPSSCKKVEIFLNENLKSDTEKECLANVLTGKQVLKADVIDLLITLIQAMTVSNEINMEDFEAAKLPLDGEEVVKEKKISEPGTSGTQKVVPNSGPKIVNIMELTEKEKVEIPKTKFNKDNVCYFYATNKCKFGKDCRKAHPKICNKFKKFGLKKFNKINGCSEECDQYHPMACFESMKTKTCKRPDCKFYHINGTKKEELLTGQTNGLINSQNNGNLNPGTQGSSNQGSYQNATLIQPQVFQETRQPWEIAIEKMATQMEKMMILQQYRTDK